MDGDETEYCFGCEEPIATCACTAPCPGCGSRYGYTCRADCPHLPAVISSQAREDDAMRNDDWDDPRPEREGFEDVDEEQ